MNYIRTCSIFLFLVFLFSCSQEEEEKKDAVVQEMAEGKYEGTIQDYQEYIKQNYKVFAIPMPKSLTFAGEPVPLDNLFVRENLDREILVNTYWHSNSFLFQKRASRWFPLIEKILAENNMPDDLKYLALIESGLDNVSSPAGAAGFWQFMENTAQGHGLEINSYVDERYNLEKSTKAACEYLQVAYKQFDSWSLAAASYNMGKGGLNNQLTKQKVETYYELYLNKETSRYVYRILAAKLILSNTENFGFHTREIDKYKPYSTYSIQVDSSISDLAQYAIDKGINYATLKALNPWIRSYELPNNGEKTYTIKLPRGDFHIQEEEEESLPVEINEIDSLDNIVPDSLSTIIPVDSLSKIDSSFKEKNI